MRKRKLITIVLGIIMVLPLFLGLGGMKDVMAVADIPEGNQLVTLHKLKYTLGDNETLPTIENTGDILGASDLGTGTPLARAVFTAYDVSKVYWNTYDTFKGSDAEKSAAAEDEAKKVVPDANTVSFKFAETDVNGEAVYKNDQDVSVGLPMQSNVDGKLRNAIYLFKETGFPGGVVQSKSADFILGLPVYKTNAKGVEIEEAKENVHIYPKNEVKDVTLGFTKYGVGETGIAAGLSGAKFVLKAKSIPDAPNLNGTYYDRGTFGHATGETILSGAAGKVSVPISGLKAGVYEFYEIDSEGVSTKGSNTEKDTGLYHYDDAKNPVVTAYVSTDMTVTYEYYGIDTAKVGEPTETGKPGTATSAEAYNYKVPTPTKKADDTDLDAMKPEPFTISQLIPVNISSYTEFSLVDTFDSRLQLVSTTETALLNEIKTTLTNQDLVDLITGVTISGNTFTVHFDLAKVKANPLKTIKFKVAMMVNVDKIAGLGTPVNNKISFENNFEDRTAEENVETFGKSFLKVDGDKKETTLAGAFFYVRKGDKYLGTRDGKLAWEAPSSTEKDDEGRYVFATGFTPKELDSDDYGKFEITGLAQKPETDDPVDTKTGNIQYELEEFIAPDGYVLLKDTIKFNVDNGTATLPVANKHKGSLPSTGGTGIVAFVLIGVVAVGGAALYFTKGRRQIEG